MKKLLIPALALIILLSLAACGGGNGNIGSAGSGNSSAPPASSGGSNSAVADITSGNGIGGGGDYKGHPVLSDYASLSGAGAFDMFSRFGLSDDAVIPTGTLGITRYTEDDYDDSFVRTEYGFEAAAEPTKDEMYDYARTLYEAMKACSDDGNIYVWWSGDWSTDTDDGYMLCESYGDVRAAAMFPTLQVWYFSHGGHNWWVTASTDEKSAPHSHWEYNLSICTAMSEFTPIVEGEHTPEPEPFVDFYMTEAEIVGKTITDERLVYREELSTPGADYNIYAARKYGVYIFDSNGEISESWTYYFYDDEASYEQGLEKNLADDVFGDPPAIASKMSLYIAEGGKPWFPPYDNFEEAYKETKSRDMFYTVIE